MTSMIHRDERLIDEWETLCSIPVMVVRRLRMQRVLSTGMLSSGPNESLVLPIKGAIRISHNDGKKLDLAVKDVVYLPRDSSFSVQAETPAEILWAQAPAGKVYPSYVKRFSEVSPVVSGAESYRRRIYTLIGEKDPAERLIAGYVEGDAGNWTSFPPHRHDGKPEVYVYYGMGSRFGVQVVAGQEDEAYVVWEGDSVMFEEGYHPNVATPGVGMKFVWIISADPKERNLSVELHPEYREMPMGQTHLTTR